MTAFDDIVAKLSGVPDGVLVGFKVIRPGATPPVYAKDGDAGFDLVALQDYHVPCGTTAMVPLGYALEIPAGYEVQIRPRSGKTLQWGAYVVNSPGTVDSSFRGEVCVLIGSERCALTIRRGDKVAQGILKKVPRAVFQVVNELSTTDRGDGGFGHTGQ
jgi:dUTP pyrophosphatase